VLPNYSRRDSENGLKLWRIFPILDAVGENTKHESFDLRYGLSPARPISHSPRKSGHLSEPAPIIFNLRFDSHTSQLTAIRFSGPEAERFDFPLELAAARASTSLHCSDACAQELQR